MALRDVLQPSFRGRLRLFFIVVVLVPMIVVAVVLFRVLAKADAGRVDARLAEAQRTAMVLLQDEQARAGAVSTTIGSDAGLAAALRRGRPQDVQARLDALARQLQVSQAGLSAGTLGTFSAGMPPTLAPAVTRLVPARGQTGTVARLELSVTPAGSFARRLERLLQLQVQIDGAAARVATLSAGPDPSLPGSGDATVAGERFRVASFPANAFGGAQVRITLLASRSGDQIVPAALVVALVTLGFLGLALVFAFIVSRTLRDEVQRLLVAARRLGAGDLSVQVPADGDDEFADLGKEFNSMARQLQARLEELQRERARLQDAIRRVGESFARGLDREGLLEIVVQTAVDGIGAAGGRATTRRHLDAPLEEVARAGNPDDYRRALHAAEAAVLDAGEVAEIQLARTSALAAPLGADGDGPRVTGIVSVARADRPFTSGERELFSYLTNQAGLSVENVALHETVQRQAVTDELTGLFNHRRFQEVMAAEVERARRYDQEMGLIMLDIDNFKRVNDTYGHMQGDMVLREVARVLRQSAREIDEPARYGGEEMAVALPQTDLEGAYRFAERVRRLIEGLELPLLDGDGRLKVTASFGAASLATAPGGDKDALVAAADAALYRAKRSGKNRTVKAE